MKRYVFIYRLHKNNHSEPSGFKYGIPELQIFEIEKCKYLNKPEKDYIFSGPVLTVTAQTTIKNKINEAYAPQVQIEPGLYNFNKHKTIINKILCCNNFLEIINLILTSKQFTKYMYSQYDKVKYSVKNK